MAVLPSGSAGSQAPLEWALSALLAEALAAGGGVRVVPLPRSALLDRDLGGGRSPLALASLAEALGVDALLLVAVSPGSPPKIEARLHRPEVGEVRPLPGQALAFGQVSKTVLAVAAEAAHRLGPGVTAPDPGLGLGAPEDRQPLEGLGTACSLEREGSLEPARDAAAQALGAAPGNPFLLRILARLELEMGNRKAAAARATEALAQDGSGSGRLSDLVRQRVRTLELETTNRFREAAEILADLRHRRPGDLDAGLWEVRLLISAGRPAAARQSLDDLEAAFPASEDPRLELARAAVARLEGDRGQQLEAAGRAVDLARARRDRRQLALALLDLGAALAVDQDLAPALEAAEEAYAVARSLRGEVEATSSLLARCNNARALVLALAGRRQGAEAAFSLSLEAFETLGLRAAAAAVLLNRGRIRGGWGDSEGAREDLRRAAAIDLELGDEAGRQGALRALEQIP
jgi:tetratricopeptide (TPR) repeat protein